MYRKEELDIIVELALKYDLFIISDEVYREFNYTDLPFADGRVLLDYDLKTQELINKIIDADGLVIGTPIFQASIPGALKNLFDLMPQDTLINKTVGIVATAGSEKHYLVPEQMLLPILNYMKANVINKYVYITPDSFDGNKINDDGISLRLEALSKRMIDTITYQKSINPEFDF